MFNKIASLVLLLGASLRANSTTVTATITDSDSQVWVNGSYTISLINPRPDITPNINGTALTSNQLRQTGALNGSGALAVTLVDSTTISPVGTTWAFTICPNASSPCGTGNSIVQGSSQSLTVFLNAIIKAPRFAAISGAYGYSDTEATTIPNNGAMYYNVITPGIRLCNLSAGVCTWSTIGTGGGGATLPINAITYGLSSTTSRAATGVDVYNAVSNLGLSDQFIVPILPTGDGGFNTLFGTGVGSNLSIGGGVGGQSNVFMGYHAGMSATTERESVLIGSQAGANITGSGAGSDDMIFTIIGSTAGATLTNLGSAGVLIGQKAGQSLTSSTADVYIGVHSGTAATVTQNMVVIGAAAFEGLGAHTGNNDVFIGSQAGALAKTSSNVTDSIGIGYGALQNVDSSLYNVGLGTNAGSNITTGSNNFIVGAGGAGQGIVTGGGNHIFGYAATSSFNDVSDVFAVGTFAGGSNHISGLVSLGKSACQQTTTGSGNTCVGYLSGEQFITGSNNTAIGDTSLFSLTGAESNDTAVGASADIATGVSGAGEFGPGQCTLANTFCFKGHALVLTGTLTYTTATSDNATIAGVTTSSVCTFSPTNATAAAATVIGYISAVSANTVTITHVATSASGGTVNIHCAVN